MNEKWQVCVVTYMGAKTYGIHKGLYGVRAAEYGTQAEAQARCDELNRLYT